MNDPIKIYNQIRSSYYKYIGSGLPFFREEYNQERNELIEEAGTISQPPIIEIVPKDGVFDYANKYQAGGAQEICPTNALPAEMQLEMQRVAERAFEVLRLDVYSRVDFLVSDEDGAFYCLEVNSLPGMTPASLMPKEAKAAGLEYGELCETIIAESIKARYS